MTGMSAMDGMNKFNNQVSEINLTVSMIKQEYQYQNGPFGPNGVGGQGSTQQTQFQDQVKYSREPQTGFVSHEKHYK